MATAAAKKRANPAEPAKHHIDAKKADADLIRPAQLGVLVLQRLDLIMLRGGQTRPLSRVDLGSPDPLPQRRR